MDHRHVQVVEPDGVIEPVSELGAEGLVDHRHGIMTHVLLLETYRLALGFLHAGVGSHHQDHVAKIGLAPVVIRQSTVVHDL
ncbi:hypothetical protein D3C84_949200 [compost metagenome]